MEILLALVFVTEMMRGENYRRARTFAAKPEPVTMLIPDPNP